MTQTETYRHQRTYRSAGMLAAVLAVTVLSLAAAAVLSEESEASAEKPQNEVIYGFMDLNNKYQVTGDSTALLLNVKIDIGGKAGLGYDDYIMPLDGHFTIDFTVSFAGFTPRPTDEFEITITIDDGVNTTVYKKYTMKLISPEFPGSYSQPYNVILNNGMYMDLNMERFPYSGSLPKNYDVEYTLDWGDGSSKVTYDSNGISVPAGMPAGKNTCTLKAAITGGVTKRMESPQFTVNVQEKPTFSLPAAAYYRDAGESVKVGLDLTGIDVPGEWTVKKPQGSETVSYTDAEVYFSIAEVAQKDEGQYEVSFKAAGGAESAVSTFDVAIYKVVKSGVVTIKDLRDGNKLVVGESTLKSGVAVTETVPYTMKVLDSGQKDVTSDFKLSGGKICLNSKVDAAGYTFVFYATGSADKMVVEVSLEYQVPPSITGIKPVSGFDIN